MVSDELRPLFLLSLPRSGSTLLQRILAAHSDVATATEPWLMLPYFYTLRRNGVVAEYDHYKAAVAVEDFLAELPQGRTTYLRALETMILSLYEQASPDDTRYFIDKTPRYSLVGGLIAETFSTARFVVLWRNPLSIVASVIETFGRGGWCLDHYEPELLNGLDNLIAVARDYPDRCYVLRYEDLVSDPLTICRRLFDFLELGFDPQVLTTYANVKLQGVFNDRSGFGDYGTVSTRSLEAWRQTLANPIRKWWCHRYLQWIGPERLTFMGYDFPRLVGDLDAMPLSTHRLASDLARMPWASARKAAKQVLLDAEVRMTVRRRLRLRRGRHGARPQRRQ